MANTVFSLPDNRLYREMPLMEGTKSRMSAGRGSARVSRSRSLTTVHTEEDIVDTVRLFFFFEITNLGLS